MRACGRVDSSTQARGTTPSPPRRYSSPSARSERLLRRSPPAVETWPSGVVCQFCPLDPERLEELAPGEIRERAAHRALERDAEGDDAGRAVREPALLPHRAARARSPTQSSCGYISSSLPGELSSQSSQSRQDDIVRTSRSGDRALARIVDLHSEQLHERVSTPGRARARSRCPSASTRPSSCMSACSGASRRRPRGTPPARSRRRRETTTLVIAPYCSRFTTDAGARCLS